MSISAELIQRVLITDIVGVNYLRPSLINSFKKFLRSGYQGVIFFFFLTATWLLNFSKWQPIQKTLVAIFRDKKTLFYAMRVLDSFRSRRMCCVLETNLTRKFAADLSLQIFFIHYISRYGYDEAFWSPIWLLLFRIWSPK